MLPYVEMPRFALGPVEVTAFELLVCVATATGFGVATWAAPRFGLAREATASLLAWTIALGFVGSHVFDVLAYRPEVLRHDPLEVLRVAGSMSSTGGIAGGLAAALYVMHRRDMATADRWRFLDLLAFAFPFAWLFGRLGCSLAHDHLGIASDHALAVAFPDGPRFDVGLLEFLATVPIATAFAWLARKPRPSGFYLGLFFTLYAPVRFGLDFLRVGETRYLGLTPAQYACGLALLAGLAVLLRAARAGRPSSRGARPR